MGKVDLWVPRVYTEDIGRLNDIVKGYNEVWEHYKKK